MLENTTFHQETQFGLLLGRGQNPCAVPLQGVAQAHPLHVQGGLSGLSTDPECDILCFRILTCLGMRMIAEQFSGTAFIE